MEYAVSPAVGGIHIRGIYTAEGIDHQPRPQPVDVQKRALMINRYVDARGKLENLKYLSNWNIENVPGRNAFMNAYNTARNQEIPEGGYLEIKPGQAGWAEWANDNNPFFKGYQSMFREYPIRKRIGRVVLFYNVLGNTTLLPSWSSKNSKSWLRWRILHFQRCTSFTARLARDSRAYYQAEIILEDCSWIMNAPFVVGSA
ncbi:hypothetical protein PG994_004899 [Apiospora phragmitis]|uniref:Uncharacterized protein n=1 Tax=Apiospora phragmitis TaxID=2905665 RepID=A0ABR1VUY0_9PEZI